jgi:hypothetical protein
MAVKHWICFGFSAIADRYRCFALLPMNDGYLLIFPRQSHLQVE